MTTTDLALADQWDPNSGLPMPAYLANALGELGTNIADRMNVPSLSYEGKTWSIVKDGNKTKMQVQNTDGDWVPVPIMRVVILNFNADRGRAYYTGVYNPAASAAPTCWSPDGVKPDASVKEKQNPTCNGCPQSVKGSKVQEGKEMVACSSHRMVAIAPALDLKADPLRLKIAVTSDYDKEVVEHGWYAFKQYTDWLKSRGVSHTGLVVTKIKFDPNTAYPKLLFALDRMLSPAEVEDVKVTLTNPKVQELLAEKWTAAGSAGTPKDDSDIKPWGLEGAYADGWQAHNDNPLYSWKGTEVVLNTDLVARYPEPKAPALPDEAAPPIPASEMVVENTAPPPIVAAHDPLATAMADGWAVHPGDPAYYFKGESVLRTGEVMALYPAKATEPVAPPPPPPPPPAPAPAPVVHHDALATAVADGWAVHPGDAAYYFKGDQVKTIAEVEALYPGNGAATAPAVPASDTPAAATTAAAGEVPAEVQELLGKWGGG
jgi:hypothetical protein